MQSRLPLALLAAALLASPALAQDEDLGGFDPIRSVSVPAEQSGTKVRGTVDVAVAQSDVVARVMRKGKQLGRMAYEDVGTGPLEARVRLFKAGRDLLERKRTMRVRFEFSVDPPADPPQRESRRVTLSR